MKKLKVQSCKLYNNQYIIASTQITNTEVVTFTALLVLQLLSHKVLLIKEKREAVVKSCSVKKVFIEIWQNSQENICARVSFLITLLKRRLWHRCFPVISVKFLRTPFFIEHLWWLLMKRQPKLWKGRLLFLKIAKLTGKLLQNYK